ncbi:MAG: cupin domain-containing protein [Bacilli bacterium]
MNGIYESLADDKEYLLLNFYESTEIFSHYHKSYEFVYCLEGKTEFFIDGNTIILHPHEIFFAPSFAIHNNRNVGPNKILSLVFSSDFMYDFEKTYPNKTFPNVLGDHEFNQSLLDELVEFANEKPLEHNKLSRLRKVVFINKFLWKLSQHYPLVSYKFTNKDKKITNVLMYINEHFRENITQEKLANHFGYNAQYLSRLFNRTVNCNLKNYINNLRLKFVEESLKNNPENKTLAQIIDESGFGSAATYYRVKSKQKSYTQETY